MNQIQELVTIEAANALTLFTTENGLDPVLSKIKKEIDAFVPDISTEEGRREIASIAHKVAKSKTYLDAVGKDLVSDLKKKPKLIDAERKRIRDTLDLWKDRVRRPLTDWENIEKERKQRHSDRLIEMEAIPERTEDKSSDEITALISRLETMTTDYDWEEFENRASQTKERLMLILDQKLNRRIKYEAEQIELEKLRRERAEIEQKNREAQIAQEAVEREKREAADKIAAERRAAEKLEQELQRQKDLADRERRAAEEREHKSKLKAEQEKADAIRLERERAESEKIRQDEMERARQADKAHRAKVNRQALSLLEEHGVDRVTGMRVVTLAAKGSLGPLEIRY